MIRKCDENNSTVVKKYATTKKTLEIQTFKAERRYQQKNIDPGLRVLPLVD